MASTNKKTVKDKKPGTSKMTASKRLKKTVYKFDVHKILKERRKEEKLLIQAAILESQKKNISEETDEEMKAIDKLYQEAVHDNINLKPNDELPDKNFCPVGTSNCNIPFKDSSDSDITKLCMQRLQIMLIEGNELKAVIHFNHLMRANWSPAFDTVQNILCKWHVDLDSQTSDPSLEYQIKDYKNIGRHNFELVINFLSSSILKNNKKFSADELLTIAKYTVTIYIHLSGEMINVLQRLFSTCIETSLEEDNTPAIMAFVQQLYSKHDKDDLLNMTVSLFLPLKGPTMKKMYTCLTYKLYKSLLGKTKNKKIIPSSIKEWFVQDLVNKNYFKKKPKKVLSNVVQLLEHVVFIFDLYKEEKKLRNMYDFLYDAVKTRELSEDSMRLINVLDQWRLRLFAISVNRTTLSWID